MPEDTDLHDLLARCALRDRAAFAALYNATSVKLFSVVRRILGQDGLAEDTLQDVYLKIWNKAGDYHAGKGQPMTWLISIARYRAIDVLRSRGRSEQLDNPLDQHPLADAADGPAQLAERHGEQAMLDDCLKQLPEVRRDCLILAYCEGYTHDELSRRLASPIGTIKSWIRRGLASLRDCLEAQHA